MSTRIEKICMYTVRSDSLKAINNELRKLNAKIKGLTNFPYNSVKELLEECMDRRACLKLKLIRERLI